jgi:hypothetical protein
MMHCGFQTAVVHILRRFGCKLCRGNALELQKIASILETNNVRIIAIGMVCIESNDEALYIVYIMLQLIR